MKQLSIIGNLTADCKRAQNGALWFAVAVDNGKDNQGNKLQPLYVSVYGAPLSLEPFLKKGLKVFVSGQTNIRLVDYTDNQGAIHPAIDIVIFAPLVQLIASPKNAQQ